MTLIHHAYARSVLVLFLVLTLPVGALSQALTPIQVFRGIELGSELKSGDREECPKTSSRYVFPVGDEFRRQMGERQCWTSMNEFALKLSSPLFVLNQIHNVPALPGLISTVGTVVQEGRIEAMESLFGRESYQNVRDAMVEKYGPFDKEERISFQNRFGASYIGRRAIWDRPNSLLRVDEVLESSNFAAVSLYSRKYLDSLAASNGSARDALKKGL